MNDESRLISSESKFMYSMVGDPIAWCRAGLGNGRFYDKQKHEKLVWGITISQQHGDRPMFVKPLHLNATFYFRIPKTHYKKRDEMMATPMSYTPDLDNLLKFICDCCSGVLYKDDAIVSSVSSRKIWNDIAKTEFSFTEMD